MSKLYLKEYGSAIAGRQVYIACREGILRDHLQEIINDIKFLVRQGAITVLLHNVPNRVANRKLISRLEQRLPATEIARIAPEENFYESVMQYRDTMYKVIFLERRFLQDAQGRKINAVTTDRMRQSSLPFADHIANVNFRDAIEMICLKIEAHHCERVHILPAAKHAIKNELFTVEGSGTLIANNFKEEFRQVRSDDDVAIIHRILTLYKRSGYLKPRSKAYLKENRHRFYMTVIDNIAVGCIEQKIIDERTVELGALAISTRFRNQRVGVYTVTAFLELMIGQGYSRFISLTNNPRLEALYMQLGFVQESRPEYGERQLQSPDVKMFYKSVAGDG